LFCTADDTIEPPFEVRNASGHITQKGVDGMGYIHQCRDATNIIKQTELSIKSPVKEWDWTQGQTLQSEFDGN
jgi:hypothetical protein